MGKTRTRLVAAAVILAGGLVIAAVVLATRSHADDGPPEGAGPDAADTDLPAKRLLRGSDLTYLGSFKVPELPRTNASGVPTCRSTSYMNDKGQVGGLGYNPANDSLFMQGTIADTCADSPLVAELSIPTPVVSANLGDLKRATLLQDFADLSGGRISQVHVGELGVRYGGILVEGDRVYWSGYCVYDARGAAARAFGVSSPTLSAPNSRGMFALKARCPVGAYAGLIAAIPPDWQPLFLGFTHYAGLNGPSIISRLSAGPAMVCFEVADLGPVPALAKVYLYYPGGDHATYCRLWDPNGQTQVAGGCFIDTPNRYGILYVGTQPVGQAWYGPGTGGPGGATDPCAPNQKGTHSTGGNAAVAWVYDPNVVARHVNGGGGTGDLTPTQYYLGGGQAGLPVLGQGGAAAGPSANPLWARDVCCNVSGLAYDPAAQRLYLLETNAYHSADGYERYPLIHVYAVP
jgi:hypothetical protein